MDFIQGAPMTTCCRVVEEVLGVAGLRHPPHLKTRQHPMRTSHIAQYSLLTLSGTHVAEFAQTRIQFGYI